MLTTSLLEKKILSLESQIERLTPLVQQLKNSLSVDEKLLHLNAFPVVRDYLKSPSPLRTFLSGITPECELVIKAVIATSQAKKVFHAPEKGEKLSNKYRELLEVLIPVEKFYTNIGGVVGYHWMMLRFLSMGEQKGSTEDVSYHPPKGIDISSENGVVRDAIYQGLKRMNDLAEIYPVGGAADRLRLHDEKTGAPLPAARLLFCGKTLLEGMIADLQGREYLHYKLFGKQVNTPIAMMTSLEKNNHAEIVSICEEKNWFCRSKESFRLFCQPCVPTMNKKGEWCLKEPMQLLLKPGGHGVIWKLARDEGVFDWFFAHGKKKALVRQINNPMAACDYGLLAFLGLGSKHDKTFGFASCARQIKASEGVNVLIEKNGKEGYEYALTNIEYCNFKKFNIEDQPVEPGSAYSKFPSNTNILFIDLETVACAASKNPFPGMLVNLKKSTFQSISGEIKEEEVVRLESTMQNIADALGEKFQSPCVDISRLKTFLTYNDRKKTISTVKREFVIGSSLLETPEGCFLDILKNAKDLLEQKCGMQVPTLNDVGNFFAHGPSFIFLYHPALGPLYSIIVQKIRGGHLREDSELQLEIAELYLENLDLDGTLHIRANAIMGHHDDKGVLNYSNQCGKCFLKNVQVQNLGIDRASSNIFWKNDINRKESCTILLHGNSEFYAENITIKGNHCIEVEDGYRMEAVQVGDGLKFHKIPLEKAGSLWEYLLEKNAIVLKQK